MLVAIVMNLLVSADKPPKPVKAAPFAYFAAHCERCHGVNGANYGDQFAKNLDDKALAKVVEDMCAGPGQAELADQDLAAQIAFHRALARGEAFIAVTAKTATAMTGEITPGATMLLQVDKITTKVIVKEGVWTIKLPPTKKSLFLFGKLNKSTTKLDLNKESFSHSR